MKRLAPLLAVPILLALVAPAALARDPGRWAMLRHDPFPGGYNQGITSNGRSLFFDGALGASYAALYRNSLALTQRRGNTLIIPQDVRLREGYNHIGDIGFVRSGGGRVLLPLECYTPGAPNGGNTCGTGSIAVADPSTLAWRYYVKLDPAGIPKAMWVEPSPDGRLLWTSARKDLLAYRTADVTAANAAPAAAPIRAVKRLKRAVPPSGITGAVFHDGRLFVAGSDAGPFQIWSVDLTTGKRRLEFERRFNGESEGLDVGPYMGGLLHWMILPFDSGPPTFGNQGALLELVPAGRYAIRLTGPRVIGEGLRTVEFRASYRLGRRRWPLEGARVTAGGKSGITQADGHVTLTIRLKEGVNPAVATFRGLLPGTFALTARPN
ncbi:MAG TPA: hypothetical protein VF752_14160 [Thermoleophilaceae bacterium]